MADNTQEQQVSPIQSGMETVKHLAPPPPKKMKTAADWVRDLRMNADVNKTTVGVETDHVTPDLMLATSSKLLGISRRQIEPDPKDSLEFQRIYGPAEYFSEHILRDAGRLGRQLLWKATNRGNLDFMSTGALDQHVSDVFNSSKLANMIDGSSPLETVDASFKVTRIGEGGVGDISSAPDEMRLVQPSFLGYIDSVRSPECATQRHEVLTINGWKPIADVTTGDSVACMVNGKLEWHKPERVVVYPYEGPIYAYDDGHLAYELTPDHRAWCDTGHGYTFQQASDLHGTEAAFQTLGPDGAYDKPGSIQMLPLFYKKFFYQGNVYCLTVPGGMFYTRIRNYSAFWTGNSLKVGLDAYMTKHCMKGSDGKLYQEFINARTGKKELVDSVTAAKSVVTTPDMMKAKTNHIYAVGGKTGVRIVKKSDVDYYLPNMDEAFSTAANLVTNMSGVKEMRLLMGCLHPMTTIVTVGTKNDVDIIYAKDASTSCNDIPGVDAEHHAKDYKIRTTVAKFPRNRAWFRKIVLCSGRVLITSKDHRWPVWRDGRLVLVDAEKLKPDDQVLRTTFKGLPSRRTFVNDTQVTPDVAELLGFISRSGRMVENRLRIAYGKAHREALETAVARLGLKDVKFYVNGADDCLGVSDKWFVDWVADNMGFGQEARVPSVILGARPNISIHFLDAYTADQTLVAEDALEYTWILDIPSVRQRDGLALLWARMGTDTYYRDAYQGDGRTVLALKLTEFINPVGDCVVDIVKANLPSPSAPIMIDIDIDDNMYATANGVVTHNSKYPLQAVSIEGREPPLVRNLDMRSGSDIHSKIGRYLGARYANKPGIVTAVRQHAIDVQYDDGTKGRVAMYDNFPMNAKGFLTNTPQVKAGDRFKKGDLLASSNYTDDKGTMATGTNLRVGWLSWHGGTYEDAVVLSESAAKKLTSTTMYSTDLDLDKTVALGKKNYQAWKPDEFTAEQLSILDDEGIVKPGTILQKGDPMVLAVRTTEPSPGTMGKRILTDISETWEHDHPGKVTDIVRTRNGVRVLATVTAPAEVGDKVSGLHGNKGVVSCYDERTEIFTENGWLAFSKVTPDTRVLTLRADGKAVFELPKAYHYHRFDGELLGYRSEQLDFLVTDNHRMFVSYDATHGYRLLAASECYGKKRQVKTIVEMADWTGKAIKANHNITITLPAHRGRQCVCTFNALDFCKLLGIYLAEGSCTIEKAVNVGKTRTTVTTYSVYIAQKRSDNDPESHVRCDAIEALLDRLGVAWKYGTNTSAGNTEYRIRNKALCMYLIKLGHAQDKYVPLDIMSLDKDCLQALFDWYYMGDGAKVDTGRSFCTASTRLAHDMTTVATLLGYRAKERIARCAGQYKHKYDVHYVAIGRTDQAHMLPNQWYKEEYHGLVYCVTTTNGIVYVRRNGKPMWCGNCVIPDDQMPKDKDGKPLEMLLSPLGLISRCYDEQTEFLTRDGWKRGADVLDTDLLYCYDPVDNTWRWDKQLTPMHKFQHKGRMYGGKNRLVDFLVSPGHKVWTKSDYPKAAWKETVIDEIFGKRYYIPCVATMPKAEPLATDFHLPTIPIKFKDTHTSTDDVIYEAGDWAELLGWYLAEGNTTYDEPGREYRVNIAQSLAARPDNVKHIHELLTRMGLTYHYTEANRQFHIGGKRMAAYMKQFGKCDEKFVPDWLFQQPTYIIRRFLDGLWAGDGHDAIFPNKDGKVVHVHTLGLTSEKLIDQVQILLAMCGESAQKHPIAVKRPGKDKPMWRLGVSTVGRTCRLLRGDDWYCIDDYDGMIYCPSVPSGYIMTRRNGKTICMGNCNPAQLNETLLGKIAHKTGKPELFNPFYEGDIHADILTRLKQNGLQADDDFFDPETGRKIPGVVNGYSYIHKLKHLSESKESARGTDEYSSDQTPGGSGYTGAKRYGTLEIGAMVGYCLLGNVRVLTREGYMPISTIVSGRLPVEVLSYNQKTDGFEYKQVTGWFARSVGQEDLWRLTTNARQDNISNGALRGYHHSLRCTKEHRILTPDRGYVQACELKPGDLVYDRGPVVLDWQMAIIKGTVMGDGYMSKHTNKLGETCSNLRVVHGPKQHTYTRWIYEKLHNLCQSEPSVVTRTVMSPAGYPGSGDQMRMATVSAYELSVLADRFYIELDGRRHKTVPKGIVREMGYAGIAVWYMDDGSVERSHGHKAHAMIFHTCGFTVEEVNQLCEEMNAFTGLHFNVLLKGGKYPLLQLKHGPRGTANPETAIFSERLAPYITEDFRYKLGDNYPADKPVGTFWQDKKAPDRMLMHGEPCIVTESCPLQEVPPEGYVVYDITVPDNHNFIASGIVVSNSAFDNLLDNKLIRGQQNSEFWRSIRTGGIPTIPGEPLVQKKFFAHLQGSGVNVRKTPKGISVFALSNSDVNELAGPREVKTRDTYEARTFRPIDGGLFGQDVFGQNGDRWGYIQLDEPVPNPVMEEPLARLLRMTDKDFNKVVTGTGEVNGIRGTVQLRDVLSKINLDQEAKQAMQEFKEAPASKKDAALKRYTAVEEMRRAGLNPAEYMLDRIPVLPAQFRPVSSHNGLTMVADANYLYAQLLDARDDMRDAKDLPQEYQDKARENLYRTWQELVGLYDPEDIKLRNKNVGGLLKWALGTSPKFSAFHRKVLGGAVDTVGRGVIVPNARLTIDQVGIPISMAFGIMAPFVERGLVKRGYTPVDAMKMVKNQDKRALDVLQEVVKTHPVEINRAPTLHRFNIQAQEPVLVQGHSIQVHPSICPALAGDFDGDQINIHVPVSDNARREAMEKMRPSRNLIAPSDRKILFKPEKEYMQGLYIATRLGKETGRPVIFRTVQEAKEAYRSGAIDIDTPIRIMEQK